MSTRQFATVPVREGATVTSRYRLTCGSCGCGETLGHQNFGASIATEQVPKKFEAKGWAVGKRQNGADDLCPACVSRDQERRRNRQNVVAMPSVIQQAAAPDEILKADPPREMTRDHRRVILVKLEEVYLDETRGYSEGWTDARLAIDLGVPRAWIAKLRDENFGPNTNPEIEAVLTKAKSVSVDVSGLRGRMSALTEQVAAIVVRMEEIERTASRIQQGGR